MKWSFFVGACLLTAVLMLSVGVPIQAVAAGIGLALVLTWRKHRKDLPKHR